MTHHDNEATMHSFGQRWTTFLAIFAITMVSFGCRGSKPFGRFVQVTQESPDGLPEVEAPQQRLATSRSIADGSATRHRSVTAGKPDLGKTEITMTSEDATSRHVDHPRTRNTARTKPQHPRIEARGKVAEAPPAKNLALDHISGTEKSVAKQAISTIQQVAAENPAESPESTPQTEEQRAIMEAFADYPPEVRKEAMRRLLAATSKKAKESNQPTGMTAAIERSMENLPDLPALSGQPAEKPAKRLTDYSDSKRVRESVVKRSPPPRQPSSDVTAGDQSTITKIPAAATQQPTAKLASNRVGDLDESATPSQKQTIGAAEFEALKSSGLESTVVQTISDSQTDETSVVKTASAARPSGKQDDMIARATTEDVETKVAKETTSKPTHPSDLADADLYKALLAKLAFAPEGENESERASRLIKLRHMMVLSGDLDSAVASIDGMSDSEQEFLRHQLLGLWTMVDPAGHPVASRRITTALPQLREATKFAAAATDSLELRSLSFCTEIESYGQIKPFSGNRFSPGQQVILYSEIENFTAKQIPDGFETHLQGSFDIYNANNEKVVSQLLPEDRQTSANYLRDYYIAYQMHLPKQLAAGTYRLQLTMEDVAGKKYGQASIPLEIAAK